MGGQTVTFKVAVNARVRTDLGIEGRVRSLSIDRNGVRWASVEYVASDGAKDIWVAEDHVELVRVGDGVPVMVGPSV